ncbi:MAG: hypothetical protein OXU23_17395, partial [Candidatus Poribacteria bacterium]|nr:hypothetical protein [Candidatus Poribacteria bacterium]
MLQKNVIPMIFILGIVAAMGMLFYRTFFSSDDSSVSSDVVQERVLPHHPNTRISTKAKPGEDRTLLHPLADPAKREAYRNQPIASWDEWVKTLTEIDLGFRVENGLILTPDELTHRRNIYTQHWMAQARRYKKKNHPVPSTAIELSYLEESKYYEGPQTTAAIMAEFDDQYENSFPRAAEMEETYPREAFLQRVLDKGAVIKDGSDYVYWMKLRDMLLYRKDRPDDWRSGSYGIPVTTNFAEYEEGFIERKVWENSIIQQVSKANQERSVTVYFPASHPDVYLPVMDNMTYVHRDKYGGVDAFGAVLTRKQLEDLGNKGIEPEDREIVYVDEDYNVLSDPPPVVTLQDLLHAPSHSKEIEDIQLTPENFQEVTGKTATKDWLRDYETRQASETQETTQDPNAARREAAREAAAREIAKAEFERFHDSMRQREEFETMADREVSRELARQFTQQFLSKRSLKQGTTSKGLENALELMFQHGFEEGFRRV